VVISNQQTNCTVLNNDFVAAAAMFASGIETFRTLPPVSAPTVLDPKLNAIAAADIRDMAAHNYLGTVNSTGQTLIQRVRASIPSAKAAAEVIVKGCYGNNTDIDVITAIAGDARAVAIMDNPNWTHYGIGERPDLSHGSPNQGIFWVVIFAQE
jgi:uncharacterized protein YkwD